MCNTQSFVQKKITFIGSSFRNVIFYKAKPQQRRPEEEATAEHFKVICSSGFSSHDLCCHHERHLDNVCLVAGFTWTKKVLQFFWPNSWMCLCPKGSCAQQANHWLATEHICEHYLVFSMSTLLETVGQWLFLFLTGFWERLQTKSTPNNQPTDLSTHIWHF